MRVNVFITPRKGILDPQGRAVEGALKSLGFDRVAHVHVGRYLVIDLGAASSSEAEAAVKRMCDQLLANTNIEDYRLEIEAVESPVQSARGPTLSSGSDRKSAKDAE